MTIHPGGDKMYKDMKRVYFWAGMKKDVAEYVARCLVCQQVKRSKRNPAGCFTHWRFHYGSGKVSRWILWMGYRDQGRVIREFGL